MSWSMTSLSLYPSTEASISSIRIRVVRIPPLVRGGGHPRSNLNMLFIVLVLFFGNMKEKTLTSPKPQDTMPWEMPAPNRPYRCCIGFYVVVMFTSCPILVGKRGKQRLLTFWPFVRLRVSESNGKRLRTKFILSYFDFFKTETIS